MIDIVVLCGKAASGKDSILKDIMKREGSNDIFYRNISLTTRSPREGEVEGIDYNFISKEKMLQLLLDGEMLEVAEFNGWFYGTSLESLSKDKINISIYNPEGVDALVTNPEVNPLIFYIDTTDKTRLLRYLTRENNPNIKEMIRRYGTDDKDFNELFESDIPFLPLVNEVEEDYEHVIDCIIDISKNYFIKD